MTAPAVRHETLGGRWPRLARATAGAMERRAPALGALVALVAGVLTITSDPIGVFHDDGIYLLTARALAEGQGFVYPQLPGLPPAIHYPPAWPALLSLVWRVAPEFPDSVSWFKLMNPLILAAGAAGMVAFAQRLLRWPGWVAFLVVTMAVVSLPVLLLTTFLLSEPLFIALLFPALWLCERLRREDAARLAAAAGALVALLMLTRSIGIVVLVATVAVLAFERRWRAVATFTAVAVALLLPWQLYVWSASATFPEELRGSYGPYFEWVVGGYREGGWDLFLASLRINLRRLVEFGGSLVLPWMGTPARIAGGVALIAAVGAALATLWATGRVRIVALALLGYVLITLLWPFHIDRFLWAAWPLLIVTSLAGWQSLAAWLRPRSRAAALAVAGLALAVVATHEVFTVLGLRSKWREEMAADRTAYGVLLARAVNRDPRLQGKVIVSELAPLVALYGGETVLPNEILTVRQHIQGKKVAEHRAELEAIDARFRPEAYVLLQGGPYLRALLEATLADGRRVVDVSHPRSFVRTLLVRDP